MRLVMAGGFGRLSAPSLLSFAAWRFQVQLGLLSTKQALTAATPEAREALRTACEPCTLVIGRAHRSLDPERSAG